MAYPTYPADVRRTAIELRASGIAYCNIPAKLAEVFPDLPRVPTWTTIQHWVNEYSLPRGESQLNRAEPDGLEARIEELRKAKRLPKTLSELCDLLDRGPAVVKMALTKLKERGLLIEVEGDSLLQTAAPQRIIEPLEVTPTDIGEGIYLAAFGAGGDLHIGHQTHRKDVTKALYTRWGRERDMLEMEIFDVYLTGNILEGPPRKRINLHDLAPGGHTLDGQIELLLESIPEIPGLRTRFITGDCHEGWWQQESGFEVGKYIEDRVREAGRTDIEYLGFLHREIVYECPEGDCVVELFHPGGGSSYALSYAPQKIVESIQGGTKPDVLLLGHFHKAEYLPGYRNVHVLQTGCCCDQSTYMEKKRLAAHVGGWTVRMWLDRTGLIREFTPSFYGFFDRAFYVSKRLPVDVGGTRRLVPSYVR